MKTKDHPELEKSEIISGLPRACSDESAAVEFFEEQRWGKAPLCPHCSSERVYKMGGKGGIRSKRFLWRCRECNEQYTVRIGTVLEDSRIPLRHWAFAFWRASTSKKGVSALEIQRQCQITYKSALFLMHRIRFALTDDLSKLPKISGTCEIDETYCGGKPRPGVSKKEDRTQGFRKGTNKTAVIAMVERGGEVRTKVLPVVTPTTLRRFLAENIDKATSTINTDQANVYIPFGRGCFRHDQVNHTHKEYARHNPDGTVSHVNTAESFFSLLKRGLHGIFHAVSREHLHRYCGEFQFRWNNRTLSDGARVALAIKSASGKRLTYKDYVWRG
jgi:transposase-like protein